jgi:hypothetical protein
VIFNAETLRSKFLIFKRNYLRNIFDAGDEITTLKSIKKNCIKQAVASEF